MEGLFQGHTACVKCSSKDALSIYKKQDEDGNEFEDGFCFSCESYIPPKMLGHDYEFVTNESDKGGSLLTDIEEIKEFDSRGIKERKIMKKYCEMYGMKVSYDQESGAIDTHYYPVTKEGEVTGYKVRELPKTFRAIGDTKKCELFGQHLFSGSGEYANKVSNKFLIITEGECFTEDCEIMTPKGWMSIKDVVENEEKVIAVDSSLRAVEENPVNYIKKFYNDDLVEISTERFYSLTTKNHKMMGVARGKIIDYTADTIPSYQNVPTSAELKGGGLDISNDEIALIIAVAADFKIDKRASGRFYCHAEFKKERKIERTTELLHRLGIEYTSYDKTDTAMERITFNFTAPEFLEKSLNKFGKNLPDNWPMSMDQNQRMFVLRELGFWDGHIGARGYDTIEFTSKHKKEVEKVQQICALSGVQSRTAPRENQYGKWWRIHYYFDKKSVSLQQAGRKHIPYQGIVYCVETMSGYLITRQNNIVSISGNCDAIAMQQAMCEQSNGDFINAVVGLPNGANAKSVKENYKFVNSFQNVILVLDQDEPGKKAAVEIAKALPMGKAKIASYSENDPSDMLRKGKEAELSKLIWKATPYSPAGIVSGEGLWEVVSEPVATASIDYPYKGLNDKLHGIRTSELVTMVAGSGVAKSTFARAFMYHILSTTDENVAGMFLEESIRKTGLSLMSFDAKKLLHLPDHNADENELRQAFENTLGTGRVFLFDSFGSNDIDDICENITYFAKAANCKYIFLDHISILVSGNSHGDERRALDEISTKLRTLVQELDVTLFMVCHLKRPEGKPHECGAETNLGQLRGSAGIGQLSDIVIGIERNGQAEDEDERNTSTLRILKNRFSGETSIATRVRYNPSTGELTEVSEEDIDTYLQGDVESEFGFEEAPWDE